MTDLFTPPTDIAAVTKALSASINDLSAAVEVMDGKLPTEAQIKRGTINFGTDTGTANTYLVALPYTPSGYVDGLEVEFIPLATNTGATTINVNSLGVKSLKRADGSALSAGDVTVGIPVTAKYSTVTGFMHMSGSSSVDAAAAAASASASASSASAASSSASAAASSASAASTSATNAAASAATASAATTFLQAGSGAVTRTNQNKMRDIVSVKDFGAVGDGATDDLAAFQAAAAASKPVYVPAGTYVVSGTTTISQGGSYWYGDGISASIISSSDDNTPIFSINTGLNGVTFFNMQLTRSVTAIAGGDGIKSSTVSIGQARMSNLLIQKQYNGLNLGPTDWSEVEKVIVQKCQNTGVSVTNTATDGACQWSFDTVLSQMNAAQGFLIATIAGPAQMTIGTFKNCATFANTGVGMGFAGSSGVPIQGVRINGGFIGEDGNSEIYLDTYGGQHIIEGVFLELSGRRTTGPTLATAASTIGSGIQVTSNNTDTLITGCHSNGNSHDGFYIAGTNHALGNCRATNNGATGTAGRRNGVNVAGGRAVINGGTYGNTGAGTSQLYGVFVADGNNLSVIGADLTNNATAATGATASATYITKIGCLPNTLDVGLSPAGAVLVGGGATGDWNAAGTINVAGGLLKNDTAYTNP